MASFTIDARNRLQEILQRFEDKNVLVVGDLILDHYIETATRKLAREAPIPVSKVINERSFAGGAANLAVNIAALGSKVHVAGVVGKDYEGDELDSILRKDGIDTDAILKIDRDTTLQTRYYLDNHLHLRIDREITDDLPKYITDKLFENIKYIIDNNKIDCICISDYDKGTITPRLLRYMNILTNETNIPIYGQPMIRHYLDFIGFTAIKSNIREASKATGISILNESSMHNLGINLLTRLSCKYLILTRGKKGLIAFEDNSIISIPSLVEKEYRRSVGIRDAMTAILALAFSSEADLLEAALLCNIAAAISTQGPYTLILSKKAYQDYIAKFEAQLITKVPLHR